MPRGDRVRPLQPVQSRGRFFRWRLALAASLIAVFLGLPHLQLGGKPAFQIDLATRQLHLMGTTFFATDTLLLAFFGVALVVFIVLFTALFGRVWCGWACPQPIYLEFVFRPLETLFEGPPARRRRARGQPLTAPRLFVHGAKWLAYLAVALILSSTFVGYFVGGEALRQMVLHPASASFAVIVTVGVVTTMMLVDYLWFRELTCVIACPYGRLQSVLVDARSWIVGYDPARGEPRRRLAARRRDPEGAGDCIDCLACVSTCPTGIDIRQGLQLECIGCTQCMDACDHVMDRTRRPRGLIRYTSLEQLRGHTASLWRPRVLVYAAIVVAAVTVLVWLGRHRQTFEVDVVRRTGAPFYVQADGAVCNPLRVRLTNRSPLPQRFTVELREPSGARLIAGGSPVTLTPREVRSSDAIACLPRAEVPDGRRDALLWVSVEAGQSEAARFVLLGPARGAR